MSHSPFLIDDFEPVYLATFRAGGLEAKVSAARRELQDCRACPRDCGIDRTAGEVGICRTGRLAIVSSAFPHHGEEDCLRGSRGSGTIFFSMCNLRCVFCQNWEISQRRSGRELDAADLAAVMLRLQEQGCHNINFVTPEHVAPQIVEALAVAIPLGLTLPLVYNTSAYDGLASLRLMDGLIDIYMPDFKFWKRETARRLAKASDYPEAARAAIREMHRQVGVLTFRPDGLACRGVLVRHLVMPGMAEETGRILAWLGQEVSKDTYVNIMGQYRPDHRVVGSSRYSDVNRRPAVDELESAYRAAAEAGLWRFDTR